MNTCGQKLMEMLGAYGIDTAFGIPGTHTIELYRGLPGSGIRHVTPRHEQAAGFMADGYARATGRPAVCLTVSGPGALNIATAMSQALQDSIPMLVISADNATYKRSLGEGRLHEVNNLQLAMSQCSVWSHTLMRPDEMPMVLARAFAIFRSQRAGPVHIILPQDVITADASHVAPTVWPSPSVAAPDPSAIQAAAELLNSARRPVIALGGGAIAAAAEIRALAEKLDAPLTVTQNAKGILPRSHPLYVAGSPAFDEVRALYHQSDVVLAVGTELAETDYDFFFNGRFSFGDAKLIRIDHDIAQLSRNALPTLPIFADCKLATEALLSLIEQRTRDGAARTQQVNTVLKEKIDNPGYQAFLDTLQEALPGMLLVGDSTQPAYFAASQYHPPAPRSFACAATGFGTLGYALPAAFGAKLGTPDRPVVALLGDGGIQFTINELSTATEAEIPVAIIVWNNQSYDMIAQNFRDAGMEPIACHPHSPDFVKLAEAYGCYGCRVRNLKDLKSELERADARKRPTLIEVAESDFVYSEV